MIGSLILEQIPLSITVTSADMKETLIQPNEALNVHNVAITIQKVVMLSKEPVGILEILKLVQWSTVVTKKSLLGSNICKNNHKRSVRFPLHSFYRRPTPVIHNRKKFSYEKS